MHYFQELGALVEKRWREQHYNEDKFPEIAAAALADALPHEHVDPWDIIRWLNTAPQLPAQPDPGARFGDPPIAVYQGARFHISVYFWVDGSTTIHQHAFSGAFQVHRGSSIRSQYQFREKQMINPHLASGDITLTHVELLNEGDIRPIWPGRQYIHSLFHLDRPSVTTIIRTYQTPGSLPQYNYLKPSFAIDPFFQDDSLAKKLQSAGLLMQIQHPETEVILGDMIINSDFHTVFAILDAVFKYAIHQQLDPRFGISPGQDLLNHLLDIARRQHGEWVELILPVLEENQRTANILSRRGQITSPEHRFFLALLLNVPNRKLMLDLVRQRYPEDTPVDTVTDWLEELSNTQMMGSTESNVLGIDALDDDYLLAFRCLLEGCSFGEVRDTFVNEYSHSHIEDSKRSVEELVQAVQQSPLFKYIFSIAPC